MIEFSHIKYGVLVAMMAILFGGAMGLSFGCCEDSIKGTLKGSAEQALSKVYAGDQAKADKVVKKSWVYMKRAHLHSQTMGVISIAFSLLVAWLSFPARAQMGISLLSGFGSLGYGVFWMLAGFLAPGMGSTGAAKESIALIAQASGGAFFVAGVSLFGLIAYRMFAKPVS
ncbi:MAG: hypothetical protein HOI59_13495 [Nitrospina sp.]|jgi:hypothetical protein|nr:hypothetical protein [Nitrospina sp.]MBT3414662.1 hypothetical protein [Nitrospina sp.]MBT3857825.1 hypothetical protein [Nitrospina sp.]MBT4105523.1 hypothetical protein [Nitrospina sp.]MBT4388660.1 hypothetical protein [Nitrospina sp.]